MWWYHVSSGNIWKSGYEFLDVSALFVILDANWLYVNCMRFQTVVSLRFMLACVLWKAGEDGNDSKSISRKHIGSMYLLCVLVAVHIAIRGQLVEATSLLPHCWFLWWIWIYTWFGSKKLSLHTEPFHWPRKEFYKYGIYVITI